MSSRSNAGTVVKNKVRSVVEEFAEVIELAGAFGSEEDDLDVLVVFRELSWESFAGLFDRLRREVPEVPFYPTFRLQAFLTGQKNEDVRPVHLLVYPSVESFVAAERPFVRFCVCQSLDTWLGSREQAILEEDPVPDGDASYYKSLLLDTAQVFLMDSFEEEAVAREVRSKLLYILRFACLELLYEEGTDLDLRHVSRTVFRIAPEPLSSGLQKTYSGISAWKRPEAGEVRQAFEAVLELVQQIEVLAKSRL